MNWRNSSSHVLAGVLLLAGCSSTQWPMAPASMVHRAHGAVTVQTPQLATCGAARSEPLELDPTRGLTIIVHGCNASGGNYAALAQVFNGQGQQAVCFNYDDRDSIRRSSSQLRETLRRLIAEAGMREITLVAHSQGGLVARRALVTGTDLEELVQQQPTRLRLVTISTPFGGIQAASHCSTRLAFLSLGLTVPICQAVTGSKWFDIAPSSVLVNRPGELMAAVEYHLKVVTDERDSCRRQDDQGRCQKSDTIFTLDEQRQPTVDRHPPTTEQVVKAGHVEIVGNARTPPWKLIEVLRHNGVLLAEDADPRFQALVEVAYGVDLTASGDAHP